jgi:hypothetical protein
MQHHTAAADRDTCLGRTCLHWERNGELAAPDLALVLERLALVDQDAAAEPLRSRISQPCPSIS